MSATQVTCPREPATRGAREVGLTGWRARLGFLVPPGNPTVEPEMMTLAPEGVSVHFTRMTASGPVGTHVGQEERNLAQLESIDECVRLLALVSPDVVVLAHTATSYTIGAAREAEIIARMRETLGVTLVTALGSVLAALEHLGVQKVAYATPYSEEMTEQGKRSLEQRGIEVVSYGHLANVSNIYAEHAGRAYKIARKVNTDDAQAIFISGVGMPTLPVLKPLEDDLQKPVISAASAMMWNALRTAGVRQEICGYGRLLAMI